MSMMVRYYDFDRRQAYVNAGQVTHLSRNHYDNLTLIHLSNGQRIESWDAIEDLQKRFNAALSPGDPDR